MAKIFVVEDDLSLSQIYKQNLEAGGHEVVVVSDTRAVAEIRLQKPNLILLDILMPQVNGLDILREIKNDPATGDIPVLLLTNVAEGESIAKGLEYGALGYLLKSETTPDAVLARVNRTLEETVPAKP